MPSTPPSAPSASARTRKSTAKRARFAARISAEQKELFERAAMLYDQPVSRFVVSSAQRAAEQALRDHEVMKLSARDSRAVMNALLHPEPAGPWFQEAAKRYKALVGDE